MSTFTAGTSGSPVDAAVVVVVVAAVVDVPAASPGTTVREIPAAGPAAPTEVILAKLLLFCSL